MVNLWKKLLPDEYRKHIIPPSAFEHHTDLAAHADKVLGFDQNGNRCFYYHSFVLKEEGFDVDEFPILVDVYYERVVAWRLQQGQWIRIKSYSDQLDRCNKHLTTLPVELTDSV